MRTSACRRLRRAESRRPWAGRRCGEGGRLGRGPRPRCSEERRTSGGRFGRCVSHPPAVGCGSLGRHSEAGRARARGGFLGGHARPERHRLLTAGDEWLDALKPPPLLAPDSAGAPSPQPAGAGSGGAPPTLAPAARRSRSHARWVFWCSRRRMYCPSASAWRYAVKNLRAVGARQTRSCICPGSGEGAAAPGVRSLAWRPPARLLPDGAPGRQQLGPRRPTSPSQTRGSLLRSRCSPDGCPRLAFG
jgi:hypothetical protein